MNNSTFGKLSPKAAKAHELQLALDELKFVTSDSEAFKLVFSNLFSAVYELAALQRDTVGFRALDLFISQDALLSNMHKLDAVRMILSNAEKGQFFKLVCDGKVDRVTRLSNPDGWAVTMRGHPIARHYGIDLCEALRITSEATS